MRQENVMERDVLNFLTEMFMKVNMKMERDLVLVFMFGQVVVENMTVNGLITARMALEPSSGLMVLFTLVR